MESEREPHRRGRPGIAHVFAFFGVAVIVTGIVIDRFWIGVLGGVLLLAFGLRAAGANRLRVGNKHVLEADADFREPPEPS